eukprot:6214217-Pleurochrysis_carterae.AAC.1
MAPATWWSMYGKQLPNVCGIAQIVLSQPASASAAERNWSIYGTIKSKLRNRHSWLAGCTMQGKMFVVG